MTFRAPEPAWMKRRREERETKREERQQEVVGHIMGLDDEPQAPVPQGEHYTVTREFLLAGRAVFTVTGLRSRYTYRILRNEPEAGSHYGPSFYVYVLTGPKPATEDEDPEDSKHRSPYSYLGFLNVNTGEVRITKGCKMDHRHPAVVAIQWALPRMWRGQALPAPAAIYHEGRCGHCARPLTDPDSIMCGFGPECRRKLGIELPKKTKGVSE